MNSVQKYTGLIICLCLLGYGQSAFSAVKSSPPNIEDLWKQYLVKDAGKIPTKRYPFERCFKSAAQQNDLPLSLVLAVARGESNFNPNAKSNRNCHGVMQIQWPETAKHLGIYRQAALYQPCTNIRAGARYLRELLDRYDQNLHLALAAYNYGPSRIDKSKATGKIPEGAKWYSGYIFHHLEKLLRGATVRGDTLIVRERSSYIPHKHIPLISFSRPFRASAYYEHLRKQAPDLDIGWYRTGLGRYQVVLHYSDKKTLDKNKSRLRGMGIAVK